MATTGPMPAWLKRHLVDTGVMAESGVTARAKAMRHRACHRTCVAGFTDLGVERWCDPNDLSAAGELAANLAGVDTYQLVHPDNKARMALRWRKWSRWYPMPPPTMSNDVVVLAEHQCGRPVPPAWQIHRPVGGVVGTAFTSFNVERKPEWVTLDNWIQFGF